ncbi:LCP family protein [Streptomyces sp. NPDC058372]|uniref:LCP family protein n=1 Tax=unclassified Streptomyces TaxID=2593676 RepID=UPI00366742CD
MSGSRSEGGPERDQDPAGALGWDEGLYEGREAGGAVETGRAKVPGQRGAGDGGTADREGEAEPEDPDEPDRPSGTSGRAAEAPGSAGVPEQPGPGRRRPGAGEAADAQAQADPSGTAPDAQPESEPDGAPAEAGAPAKPGRRRRRRRILAWTAAGLALTLVAAGTAGWFYYQHLNDNLDRKPLHIGKSRAPEPTPNAAGQTPLNILLIGSDARDSEENQRLGGARETFGGPALADVQMLLHLSADRSNMSVISMPRDTLVKVPECTDPDTGKVYPATVGTRMTNQTLTRGGPGCTVATWEELTGIRIDHFMMVDFAGVVSMADAIGGVPVCVDANLHSRTSDGKGSGLKLKKGTTEIKGEDALAWLRTRYGFGDGSDIARAKAQHMYMNSLVRELRENTGLSSPNRLRNLAEKATEALTVDEELASVADLYALAEELKEVAPNRTTMATMPWVWSPSDRNRVEPKPDDAEQLFRLVREDIALDGRGEPGASPSPEKDETSEDPAADPAEIGVLVRNSTGSPVAAPVSGRAAEIVALLTEAGFTRASADQDPVENREETAVLYPSAELEGDAQSVAEALGMPLGTVRKSTEVSGVTLEVGADWTEGDAFPKPKQGDNEPPDSAEALNGSDDSACMEVDPAFTW